MTEADTLDAALISTLRAAREFGTWDMYWYDYAPRGWSTRVRNAPPAQVADMAAYLATTVLDPLADYAAFLERLMRDDDEFARALIAVCWRENTPLFAAEVFAHYLNERWDGT